MTSTHSFDPPALPAGIVREGADSAPVVNQHQVTASRNHVGAENFISLVGCSEKTATVACCIGRISRKGRIFQHFSREHEHGYSRSCIDMTGS